MNVTVAWITLIAIFAYIVSVDENVLHWIYLCSQRAGIWGRKLQFHIWDSPISPIRKILIHVDSHRAAKQLLEELSKQNQNDGSDCSN